MAFCANCGTQLNDGAKFCAACGQPLAAAAAPPQPPPQPQYQAQPQQAYQPPQPQYQAQPQQAYQPPPQYQAQPQQPSYQQSSNQQQTYQAPGYEPPVMPGAPTQADVRDVNENKAMAILAYILFFIPLLTGAHKTSPFAKFHTNQGTVLFLASLGYGIVYGILSALLIFIPYVGWTLIVILGLLSLVFLALCIVGIINASGGKMKPLPVIGKFTIIK